MSIDPMQKLLFQVAELKRQASTNARMGTIHEIKGDKMRVNMGLKHDGTPWLGPWIHTTDHRGGETQQEVYKVGQNVEMSALGGDFSQASVAPHGPNKTAPAPSHASEGNSTWQQGNSAHTRNDGSQNFMQGDGNDPDVNSRTSKDGGATNFVKVGGAYNRTHAHKEGVTMSWKDDENTIHVDKDGCWSSKPLGLKKPTWKADNKAK
jgi:hypothetical protein